jgi:DNA-binding NarL/FixJ family response regulator
MKTLLIVEDDRQLLEQLVFDAEISSSGWRILSACGVASAFDLLHEQRPDVMFVDLGLPDGDGQQLIQICKRLNPASEALVITVFADEEKVIRSLEAGASGYILKSDLHLYAGQLISIIDSGGSPVSPAIARRLIERLHPSRAPSPRRDADEPLTAREQEVLALCARGFRYAEIAGLLAVSVHTVNAHLKSVYRKLAVNSKSEAVFEARRSGLLDG